MIAFVTVDTSEVDESLRKVGFAVSHTGLGAFHFSKVRPFLQQRIDARFAGEGDDAVGKWRQLAFNTGLIRRSQGFPAWHPINRRTGQLQSVIRNSYRITRMDTATLTIPDRVPRLVNEKLSVAQKGGSRKAGRYGPNRPAPARPVLGLSAADSAFIVPSLARWIESGGGAS